MREALEKLLSRYACLDEFTEQVQKHNKCTLDVYLSQVTPEEWISSAFMWTKTPSRYKWVLIEREWLNNNVF